MPVQPWRMPCPCCGGTGTIELTPMQYRVWDALRRSPGGLAAQELTTRVYADRADGGPISGVHCVWVHAHGANKRLKKIGWRITSGGGHGSVYRLEPIR